MHSINLVIVSITLTTLPKMDLSCATSNPAPYPCPDFDGSPYAGATGSNYSIQCNTDYPGNDIPSVYTDAFEEYLRACSAPVPGSSAEVHVYAYCIGLSWEAGNPNPNCNLKYQITTVSHKVRLSSGYHPNNTLPNRRVISSRSSHSTISAPATSTTQTASSTMSTTSTGQPTSSPSSGSDSHRGVGIGAGVGAGVGVFGLAILAGIVYHMRRQPKRRPEEPLALSEEGDKRIDKPGKPSAGRRADELPAENKPGELLDQRGPRAELFKTRGARSEMG